MGQFLRDNWGSLASVAGVALTIWTLVSARGAKKAAEAASELARKRSLVEDLEEAAGKMQHVGSWVRDRKWEIVQLRSQEVLAICKAVLSRWSDHLGESGNNVRTACTQLSTIARLAMDASLRNLTENEQRQIFGAQLRAAGLISDALGRARKVEERS